MVETAVKIGGGVGCGGGSRQRMEEWMDGGMGWWMDGLVGGWVGGWMGWWVDEWVGGWMGEWLGLKAFVFVFVFKPGREYVCRGKQKASGE